MVIKLVLLVIKGLLAALLAPYALDALPAKFYEVLLVITGKLAVGFSVVNCYVDVAYISALFAVVVGVMAIVNAWRVIHWVLQKIPFLGIE